MVVQASWTAQDRAVAADIAASFAPRKPSDHHRRTDMSRVFSAHAVSVDGAMPPAREAAGYKDVAVMGGGALASALEADLVDGVILHQAPVLLGGGRSFFHELPKHVRLRQLETIVAPGVTHLRYEVVR
ncbi:dihydrofolate reductase family protein [Streptomyces sp. NBC_01361]|uniref:dihydrofolate reductase family protein n=1 Tax=Streptomyces sp. NBC_01361 TaxID=2903838 RepID=UPI003FCC3726